MMRREPTQQQGVAEAVPDSGAAAERTDDAVERRSELVARCGEDCVLELERFQQGVFLRGSFCGGGA